MICFSLIDSSVNFSDIFHHLRTFMNDVIVKNLKVFENN